MFLQFNSKREKGTPVNNHYNKQKKKIKLVGMYALLL